MNSISLIEQKFKDYIQFKRPPEHIRPQLDIGYSFKDNTIEVFEIRPQWDDNSIYHNYALAKFKYIKTKKQWAIYWLRESGKWNLYKPNPYVNTIEEVIQILDMDTHSCFWG